MTVIRKSQRADVAILLPDLRDGGVEKIRILLAREFIGRGLTVKFVLAQRQGEWINSLPQGSQVEDLNARRLRDTLTPLVAFLKRERPRALLAAMWPMTSIAVMSARRARVPTKVVISEHNDFLAPERPFSMKENLLMRATMPLSHPRAHQVIAVSHGVANTVATLSFMDRGNVRVIHNPVDRTRSTDNEHDERLNGWWLHEGPRLIAIGKLKHQKDYPTLIRAFALLRKHTDAKLLILGEGQLRASIEELVASLGLTASVYLPGFRPNVETYLSRAHVFVLSSAWEGFGNVIVEALGCGVQVVSTDCPSGPSEILAGGQYGTLVPVKDSARLAAGIMESFKDPIDPAKLRQRADDFRVELVADHYLETLGLDKGAPRSEA